ncbi:MAG: PEP-CTERM sorting domain-containing protein [Planctomycetota bacterium]|nr:PEP-CTERM sorting domain-containing protein [Planctomycetota bacterium]
MKIAAGLFVACVALPAVAGTVTGSGSLPMYGSNYGVTTWRIAGDAGSASTAFGAEGMTFFNGTLYVSHDHDANRAAGNLVSYTPGATGNLSAATTTLMGTGPAGLWGPEGITVNNSGSGFGSWAAGSVRITGIETRGTDSFGVFDTGTPGSNMSPTANAVPALDDIAWASSLDLFAGVEDGSGDSSFLRFFDKNTMAVQSFSAPVINGAKGIAAVSGSFAAAVTGASVGTSQAFLVVSEFDGFAFYDTNGNAIGPALTFGDYAAINELESVAVDETNNLIFLGDEAGLSIHVVSVPAPGVGAIFGLGLLAAARRRR